MSTTPEGKVKAALKARMTELGMYWFMPVQKGYGEAGLDFYATWNGWFIAIETKRRGQKMTPRQQFVARKIIAAGGIVVAIDSVDGARAFDPSTVIPRPTPGPGRLQDDGPGNLVGLDWLGKGD